MRKSTLFIMYIFALAFHAYAKPILVLNGLYQTPINGTYLTYRYREDSDTTWHNFTDHANNIKPQSTFEAQALFRCSETKDLVFEWPDNKIEQLNAVIKNTQGDTCASLSFKDSDGYSSFYFLKNQVLVLQYPDTNQIYTLYYSIKSHNVAYSICWVRNTIGFFNRFIKEYTWYGLFTGIIFTVFILNILFFLGQKETTFIWYALYTLFLGLFHWSYTGIGFQWIWPQMYYWNRYASIFCSFLMLSFQFIYFYKYSKNMTNISYKYIVTLIVFRFLVLAICIWQPSVIKWHLFFDTITISLHLWLIFKFKLHKTLHGLLYTSSISILVLCYVIFIAAYYQFITTTFWVYNSIALGGVLELIVGMLAISLRYKYLNDEKERLKEKKFLAVKSIATLNEKLLLETQEKEKIQRNVNQQLEIKIQERTLEISQKNKELEQLNEKLYDMSSQLDKQNWKLNKELSLDRVKLLWGKNISFKDFKIILSSEKEAIRLISELKWAKGYECKKCKCSEFTEGSLYLSRKCKYCKYEESVTANTLFHGIKFSLLQALYISLYTIIHRDDLPTKLLADEIELREATVWAFRKKTIEHIKDKDFVEGEILISLLSHKSI